MKKRHEEWLKLTGQAPLPSPQVPAQPIRMLDLPAFQRMEDKLLINTPRVGQLSPEVDDFAKDLSRQTFGIAQSDTLFELPTNYNDLPDWSPERWRVEHNWREHEEQFITTDVSDEHAIEILLGLGLDFRDQRGQPMRRVKLFARQAEAAAKGIMGRLPDREAASLESWASALERDAKEHMSRKRRV
ncbi:hypothetical protein ACQZ6F_19070 [Rhizobium sp. A22-96]